MSFKKTDLERSAFLYIEILNYNVLSVTIFHFTQPFKASLLIASARKFVNTVAEVYFTPRFSNIHFMTI